MSDFTTRVVEMTSISDQQPRVIGWASFAQVPAGVVVLNGEMWTILGARWFADTAEDSAGALPKAFLEVAVVGHENMQKIQREMALAQNNMNKAGIVLPGATSVDGLNGFRRN